MAAELVMLSPLPRRKFEPLRSLPTSPVLHSLSKTAAQEDLNTARPFWYEDVDEEASKDLQEVLGLQTPDVLPDCIPAFEPRCLSTATTTATSPPPKSSWSSASTAATSPPPPSCWSAASVSATSPSPPSDMSLPLSPDRAFVLPPDLNDDMNSPMAAPQLQCPSGALDKSSWLQARKVFVGGIPQSIDQNGLFHMFSKIGKVKKAWLQLFRADPTAGPAHATKKHRGFGFVIFYERDAIDQLLGNEFSQFVSFGKDLKLEVKRAVGKTPVQASEEQHSIESRKKPEELSSRALPAASVALQSASHVGLQARQFPRQPLLPGVQTFVNMPCVPPFPCAQAPAVQWPFGSTLACPPSAVLPVPFPQSQPLVAGPQSSCQFLPPSLLSAFAGQSRQHMELMLLQALPECYED